MPPADTQDPLALVLQTFVSCAVVCAGLHALLLTIEQQAPLTPGHLSNPWNSSFQMPF